MTSDQEEDSAPAHLHAQYRAMLLDPKARGEEVAPVHAPSDSSRRAVAFTPDSGQAWVRLVLAVIIGSIGRVGMWSVVVVLPVVQPEFRATRGAGCLALTLTLLGLRLGGVAYGQHTQSLGNLLAPGMSLY